PIGDGGSFLSVSADLTGLAPRTTYHYRIVAQNSIGTTYGGDVSFMTIIEGNRGETLFSLAVADYSLVHKQVWLGVAPDATSCIDADLGETELGPVPPSVAFDVRSIGSGASSCLGMGVTVDFRPYQAGTQVDT